MALTKPALTYQTPGAAVVADVEWLGGTIQINLNSEQTAAWTDAEMNTMLLNLRAAIAAFLPSNMNSINVYLTWAGYASAQVEPTV